jgi:Zn-dependent membrane protease YugP
MFFLDPTYLIFMLPAFILMMIAQGFVSGAYRKWSQVMARSRLTGAQVAQRLISASGLSVEVVGVRGKLTDNYDPRKKVLNLSEGVYNSPSVASLAITAHELGHAMQDRDGYFPLRLRAALVPAVNIGSYLGWILIFIGMIFRQTNLSWLGVLVFSGGAIFALATLPVELNASGRAKELLTNTGMIVGEDERKGVSNVLNAAALTYVAALFAAVMQLFYFISLVGGMGGRRR